MNRQRQAAIYPSSVGELIDRANVLARDLLYEAPQRDGRVMLRAWGEVVEGASELWRQLPQRSDMPGTGKDVIDQLERSARTLRRSAGSALEVDPDLQEIGRAFTHAAETIAGSGVGERREPSRWTDAQLRDAFAARVNIMHTLYVASHAVSVALTQNALGEQFDARLRVHAVPADELRQRVLGTEQVAYSYMAGHYPQVLAGRYREPVDDSRIPTAIASWDVHAQRVLTREPTTHAMARVAGAAFAASTHTHRLWRAAVQTGYVDHRSFDTEIGPALEAMIEKWDGAHTLFRQLTHRLDTSPASLSESCWQLPDAMREVTRGRLGPASVQDIHHRVDMTAMVRSLHRFHATLAGVGSIFHETARDAPLLVDARGANDLARAAFNDDRWSRPNGHVAVAPRDVLHKRAIPIPEGIRSCVEEVGQQAASASRRSLRATLAASDGQGNEASVPSRNQHGRSESRLHASQQLERRGPSTDVGKLIDLPR